MIMIIAGTLIEFDRSVKRLIEKLHVWLVNGGRVQYETKGHAGRSSKQKF
jgi:hypothetical protein